MGSDVRGFAIGARVAGMVQGACAEYVCLKAALAISLPASMNWTLAAAMPVSYLTAHDALVTIGGLAPGGTIMIHAVSSGVGIAALQLARLRGAALIIGTSSSPEKLERLRALGLDVGLSDSSKGFATQVLQYTDARGVDVVVDNIGGMSLNQTMTCTAIGGCVVNVGRLGGIQAEVDLNLHAFRRLRLVGATFRSRSLEEHARVVTDFLADHGRQLADGTLAPVIDSTYSFDDLPEAIARSSQRSKFGKIVLEARASR